MEALTQRTRGAHTRTLEYVCYIMVAREAPGITEQFYALYKDYFRSSLPASARCVPSAAQNDPALEVPMTFYTIFPFVSEFRSVCIHGLVIFQSTCFHQVNFPPIQDNPLNIWPSIELDMWFLDFYASGRSHEEATYFHLVPRQRLGIEFNGLVCPGADTLHE